MDKFKDIIRALRLAFVTASLFPFIFGSLLAKYKFDLLNFLLGACAVVATHLSANLINDYADSKSQADWQDKNFYRFFGGSKLIQEGRLSERFYFRLSVFFALISAISITILALRLKSLSAIGFYAIILFFAWSYSTKPLQFSYHMLGEVFIFLLFGPAPVLGGYFIQAKIFPDSKSFLLSLPFGFLTTAILFANEIPDFPEDKKVGKLTWVALTGERKAFIIYYLLMFLAFFSIALNIRKGYLSTATMLSFVLIFIAFKAAKILKEKPLDKILLMESSKLTIAIQLLVSIILILDVIIWPKF